MSVERHSDDISAGTKIDYNKIPISALNVSCRRKLALALNAELPLPTSGDITRDWRGLAELLGFDYDYIMFLRDKPDSTMKLLDNWQSRPNATVAVLYDCLEQMERFDVIDDIQPLVEKHARGYLNRLEESRLQMEMQKPIQVPMVSSPDDSQASITLDDEHGLLQNFDAYVCYSDHDSEFVVEMIKKLENEFGLKLFIRDRDLLLGVLESEADIRLIQDRCSRILVVLSPDFLSNPMCEYQTMFAHAVSVESNLNARKVIPIIYRTCDIPSRLKYLARLDYTKGDVFGSFWQRLFKSIKDPLHGIGNTTTISSISTSSLLMAPQPLQSSVMHAPVASSGFVSDFHSSLASAISPATEVLTGSAEKAQPPLQTTPTNSLSPEVEKSSSNSKSPGSRKRSLIRNGIFNWTSSSSK